jgi:hypothetical protein
MAGAMAKAFVTLRKHGTKLVFVGPANGVHGQCADATNSQFDCAAVAAIDSRNHRHKPRGEGINVSGGVRVHTAAASNNRIVWRCGCGNSQR